MALHIDLRKAGIPLLYLKEQSRGESRCRRYRPYEKVKRPLYFDKPLSRGGSWEISRNDQAAIDKVVAHAWRSSTADKYDAAVKDFINFCASCSIPLREALPASEDILCLYAASMAGCQAGGTASNKIFGLRAWHIRNNLAWAGSLRLRYTIRGTENLRPKESIKPEKPPISLNMLETIRNALDLENFFDACVWAITTTAFWGQICLGEILPSRQREYNINDFPCWNGFGFPTRKGSRSLHLPKTKMGGTKGEKVMVTRQLEIYDPIWALENHARVTKSVKEELVAVYVDGRGHRCALVARKLVTRINGILVGTGFPKISGHCFRIGGTTALLLNGIPPDVVKLMGRWTSDAFLRYWRSLEIIAPMYVELLQPVVGLNVGSRWGGSSAKLASLPRSGSSRKKLGAR